MQGFKACALTTPYAAAAPTAKVADFAACVYLQALSAAEQGEKDPLKRTSSTISLQLIMQSEAAGLFTTPASGKDGHAILAATIAKTQPDQEASQEVNQEAGQEAVIQEPENAADSSQQGIRHNQSRDEPHESPREQLGTPLQGHDQSRLEPPESPREHLEMPLQRVNSRWLPSKSQSWDHGIPGPLGLGAHDAPVQMTGMHSGELMSTTATGELSLATNPILPSQ